MFVIWLMVYFSAASSLEMNEILKELSWPLKLKILNEVNKPEEKTPHLKPAPPLSSTVPKPSSAGEANLTVEPAPKTTTKPHPTKSIEPGHVIPESNLRSLEALRSKSPERRVGIELLRAKEELAERRANPEEENDDKDMRLKLFRLMYETVRDSDLKVKRAELIKEHYTNSSSFEIGYLVGDITDKANIITDISITLKRYRREWKPIEHINAYEQISNQAIEITHLIDLVRVVNKRESEEKKNHNIT